MPRGVFFFCFHIELTFRACAGFWVHQQHQVDVTAHAHIHTPHSHDTHHILTTPHHTATTSVVDDDGSRIPHRSKSPPTPDLKWSPHVIFLHLFAYIVFLFSPVDSPLLPPLPPSLLFHPPSSLPRSLTIPVHHSDATTYCTAAGSDNLRIEYNCRKHLSLFVVVCC